MGHFSVPRRTRIGVSRHLPGAVGKGLTGKNYAPLGSELVRAICKEHGMPRLLAVAIACYQTVHQAAFYMAMIVFSALGLMYVFFMQK
jgi:hypothetical protein